jgi:hypothetical protein
VLFYKALNERDYDPVCVPLLVSFFSSCHTVSLSIFILVFLSTKFDIGSIDKNLFFNDT